jgi:hypothetical protein
VDEQAAVDQQAGQRHALGELRKVGGKQLFGARLGDDEAGMYVGPVWPKPIVQMWRWALVRSQLAAFIEPLSCKLMLIDNDPDLKALLEALDASEARLKIKVAALQTLIAESLRRMESNPFRPFRPFTSQ